MSDLAIRPQYFDVPGVYDAVDLRGPFQDLTNSGVVEQFDFYVVAKGGTSANPDAGGGARDMSVDVLPGVAWVRGTDLPGVQGSYRGQLATTDNVSIAANSSGSVRVDLIVLEMLDAPSNKGKVACVAGTPGGGAPSAPADSLVLAQVTVANGATSIVGSNIADHRTFIQRQTYQALLTGGDVRAAQTGTTDIVSVAVVLEKAQTVWLVARARPIADATGAAAGLCGIRIVDRYAATDHRIAGAEAGPIEINANASADPSRGDMSITFPYQTFAGAHIFKLQSLRDSTNVVNISSSFSFGGQTMTPTGLWVVV